MPISPANSSDWKPPTALEVEQFRFSDPMGFADWANSLSQEQLRSVASVIGTAQYANYQEQLADQKEEIENKEPPSDTEQALMGIGAPLAGIAGIWGGRELFDWLGNDAKDEIKKETVNQIAQAIGGGGAQAATTQAATSSFGPVGTSVTGEVLYGPLELSSGATGAGAGTGIGEGLVTAASANPFISLPLAAAALYGLDRGAQELLGDDARKPAGLLARSILGGPMHPGLAVDAYNKLSDTFGSGKPGSQKERDDMRNHLRINSPDLLDENYNLTLGGKTFDIGTEDPLSTGRHRYDIDWSSDDPGRDALVGKLQPLAEILSGVGDGVDHTAGQQFTGYLYNAIRNSGIPEDEAIRELYERTGMGRDEIAQRLYDLSDQGYFDTGTRDAYISSVDLNYRPEEWSATPTNQAITPLAETPRSLLPSPESVALIANAKTAPSPTSLTQRNVGALQELANKDEQKRILINAIRRSWR